MACSYLFILTIFILTICNSRGQEGNPNPVIGREMHGSLMIFYKPFLQGGGAGMGDTLPFLLSAWFWAGVCPAGRVGGQATQSGSTRTPSPAVAVVAAVDSTYRADAAHLPGRRRGKRRPRQIGRDRQIARNPRRLAVPLWDGDII